MKQKRPNLAFERDAPKGAAPLNFTLDCSELYAMNVLTCTNSEIEKIARPIWLNIVRGSNAVSYSTFSKSFGSGLLKRITEERFVNQCKDFPLLTSLSEEYEYIDCIRRQSEVSVLWRLRSTKLSGEFLGVLTLQPRDSQVVVTGVSAS